MTKQAPTDHPVHALIADRWSPYSFADRDLPDAQLRSLLEAARWAASSYNEQPWSFLVAKRDDPQAFEQMISCLVEGNQAWAKAVPVLVLTVVSKNFQRNGKPNAAAAHDLGLAVGNLSLEATARGIALHQMIGILPDRAREVYEVPESHDVLTGLAIGYAVEPDALSDREKSPRQRKSLSDFVFSGRWGEASPFVS
jgi:nitroreductase